MPSCGSHKTQKGGGHGHDLLHNIGLLGVPFLFLWSQQGLQDANWKWASSKKNNTKSQKGGGISGLENPSSIVSDAIHMAANIMGPPVKNNNTRS